MPGRGSRMPRGVVSKAQWRFFWANPKVRRFAHELTHRTMRRRGGKVRAYRSLPARKSVRGRRG